MAGSDSCMTAHAEAHRKYWENDEEEDVETMECARVEEPCSTSTAALSRNGAPWKGTCNGGGGGGPPMSSVRRPGHVCSTGRAQLCTMSFQQVSEEDIRYIDHRALW